LHGFHHLIECFIATVGAAFDLQFEAADGAKALNRRRQKDRNHRSLQTADEGDGYKG
tara:strand:+ start:30434 stop:30604 length:171 start_codon:yes stop_codon:yes gene_type:complete